MIAKGNVEIWLGDLLREQQASLHGVIRFSAIHLSDPSFELHAFLETAPAQVCCLFEIGDVIVIAIILKIRITSLNRLWKFFYALVEPLCRISKATKTFCGFKASVQNAVAILLH